MNIGTLWAQIGLDNSQLKSSAKESEQVISGMGSNIVSSIKSTVIAGAAAFGMGLGLHKIIQEAREAIQAIDALKLATIQIAAQITTMQGPENAAQHYADATKYADGLNRKLMEIDANTFANFRTLQNMTQVMTMQGVILDYNNKKQVESFTALSNAVAMYTAGQNQEIQSRQEVNALLTGHVRMTDRLALQMDGLIKAEGIYKDGINEVVKLGKQHGDLLERFTPYLVGINAAAGDIAHTWEAVTTSAQTAKFMIQAVGFRGLYEDAITFGGRFVGYLKEHAELIGSGIYRAWLSVKGIVESIYLLFQQQDGALRGWTYVIQSIGAGVNAILKGWAFLLSTVLPTLIEKFNGVISILNAMVNMGYMFGKILFDGILEAIKSVGYLGEAFSRLIVGDFAGAGAVIRKSFGADFKATMDDNLVVVRGTVAAIKDEYAKLKDTGSFNKRFDAFMAGPPQAGAPTIPKVLLPRPDADTTAQENYLNALVKDTDTAVNNHFKMLRAQESLIEMAAKDRADEMAAQLRIIDVSEQAWEIDKAMLDEQIAKEKQARESEIQYQLSIIDLKEKEFSISPIAAMNERIRLQGELFSIQQASLNTIDKAADPVSWYAQADAIKGVRDGLIDLHFKLQEWTGSAMEGFKSGVLKYIYDPSLTTFNQMEGLATDTAQAMSSSFSTFFTDAFNDELKKGADYFNDFLTSILNSMSKILADRTTQAFLQAMWGQTATASTGFTTSTGQPIVNTVTADYQAKGGIFSGGISAYRNQVVSQPTIFPFARGIGLMGESGSEAIMPLKRTKSGNLGVESTPASISVPVSVNITNQTGQQVTAEASAPHFDGEQWVVNVMMKAMDKNASVRSGMRSAVQGY